MLVSPAIPQLLQVGLDLPAEGSAQAGGGAELRGFLGLLAQRHCQVRRIDSRHRFLLGTRGAPSETSASSASISSTVGKAAAAVFSGSGLPFTTQPGTWRLKILALIEAPFPRSG